MDGAKEFLEQTKEFVYELKNLNEFTTKVMQSDKPVILDCFAE